MARKPRDYKAEYARAKAKAQSAGYQSQREYKQARKVLRLPRNAPIIPKSKLLGRTPKEYRELKDVRKWSLQHSRQPRSKYKPGQDAEYTEAYFGAYVNRPRTKTHAETLRDLRHYLTTYEGMTDEQFDELYTDNR